MQSIGFEKLSMVGVGVKYQVGLRDTSEFASSGLKRALLANLFQRL